MRVRAVRVADEVVREGRSVVLLDSQVLEVSEIGTAVRALAPGWTGVEEVAGRLEEEFGAPEGGATLEHTVTLLRELAAAGLVELDGDGQPIRPKLV